MRTAKEKDPFQPPPQSLAAHLAEQSDSIIQKFADRVRHGIGAARNERLPVIVNTVPAFLRNPAEAVAPNYPRQLATEGTTIASEHGGERARLTRYSPAELIREYQILRDLIFEEAGALKPLSDSERRIIIQSVDHAMSESLTAYFLVHEGLRQQFIMTLTHDLRNPLSAIKACTDMILRFPDRPGQVPLMTARIVENVRRIDRMTQDLLDASRVHFGEKLHFDVADCDLKAIAEDVIAQLSTVHGNRFVLEGDPIRGYWNADAFKRAMENLLVNAVKYGDPNAMITVRIQNAHDRVIFSVHNLGPVIPAEEQETLFRTFMRTRTAEGKRGWGLGLAMVRGMAEGHGGSVTVDSAPERGTTFVIDVPRDSRPFLKSPITSGAVRTE